MVTRSVRKIVSSALMLAVAGASGLARAHDEMVCTLSQTATYNYYTTSTCWTNRTAGSATPEVWKSSDDSAVFPSYTKKFSFQLQNNLDCYGLRIERTADSVRLFRVGEPVPFAEMASRVPGVDLTFRTEKGSPFVFIDFAPSVTAAERIVRRIDLPAMRLFPFDETPKALGTGGLTSVDGHSGSFAFLSVVSPKSRKAVAGRLGRSGGSVRRRLRRRRVRPHHLHAAGNSQLPLETPIHPVRNRVPGCARKGLILV